MRRGGRGDSRDRRRGDSRDRRRADSRDRRRRRGSADSHTDRDDHKSSRRDSRRGGSRRDEEDMIDKINDIFKDLVIVNEMIVKETERMRGHRSMRSSRSSHDREKSLPRSLRGKTPADTLHSLASEVRTIKKNMNEDYRKIFFENVCDSRDTRRGRGGSEDRYRDRDRGGRDRDDRDRRDRDDRDDRGRRDRDRGRGDRDDRGRRSDDRDRGRGDRARGSRRHDSREDRDGRRDDRDRRR